MVSQQDVINKKLATHLVIYACRTEVRCNGPLIELHLLGIVELYLFRWPSLVVSGTSVHMLVSMGVVCNLGLLSS